ncbi:MAG TPA: hypothetical protein VGI39_32060 [Polyangiaceae bacterium]
MATDEKADAPGASDEPVAATVDGPSAAVRATDATAGLPPEVFESLRIDPTKQIPIDTHFWRALLLGLGTMPAGRDALRGASGIEHRVVDVGVDEARKRLVVLSDAPEAMLAACIQADVQRAYPDHKVIVARTELVNLGAALRTMMDETGLGSYLVKDILDVTRSRKYDVTATLQAHFVPLFRALIGDPKVKNHSAEAFAMQLVNQFMKLIDWSKLDEKSAVYEAATVESILRASDVERQLGICPLPLYELTRDAVEKVKSSSKLDVPRELLLQLGAWGYFFPESDELALGLIDRGLDTPGALAEVIQLAPSSGHPVDEKDDAPSIEKVLASLQAKGLTVEGEMKLKVSEGGATTRETIRFKPRESLLVKLQNLMRGVIPLARLIPPTVKMFTGHPD